MTRPDIEAIEARCKERQEFARSCGIDPPMAYDVLALLDYISDLEADAKDEVEWHTAIMAEPCPLSDDDTHCTCVPILRRKIADLERSLRGALVLSHELALELLTVCTDHTHHATQIADLEHELTAWQHAAGA